MITDNLCREEAIELLLARVKSVIHNNDWPTEEGRMTGDGVTCSCPILDLIEFIEKGKP